MSTSRPPVRRLALALALLSASIGSSSLRATEPAAPAEPAAPTSTPALQPFTSDTFAALRAQAQGKPLVIAFWSTHCEPCKTELALMTRLHREHPAIKIVLVAADGPEQEPAVRRFLARYDVTGIEVLQFDDEPEERLRYSVDHTWRGELPRAYFIDRTGQTTTQSGLPDERWLTSWFRGSSE
jgi:thiol-disulfide isomerase/thioredoxin